MENSIPLQVGVGGIFALMVIREVLNFLKTRNGKSSHGGSSAQIQVVVDSIATRVDAIGMRVENLARESRDLHKWHSPDDGGEQSWKNTRMIEAIDEVKQVVENNSRLVDRLIPVLERMEHSG